MVSVTLPVPGELLLLALLAGEGIKRLDRLKEEYYELVAQGVGVGSFWASLRYLAERGVVKLRGRRIVVLVKRPPPEAVLLSEYITCMGLTGCSSCGL